MKIFLKQKINKLLQDGMEEFNFFKFKLALKLGANPNICAKTKLGYHLVSRCARSGDAKFLKTLLDFGGDPNGIIEGEENNYTPLHMAATKRNTECISVLINYGANINAIYYPDINKKIKWTPLFCACNANKLEAAKKIIELSDSIIEKEYLLLLVKTKNKEIFNIINEFDIIKNKNNLENKLPINKQKIKSINKI